MVFLWSFSSLREGGKKVESIAERGINAVERGINDAERGTTVFKRGIIALERGITDAERGTTAFERGITATARLLTEHIHVAFFGLRFSIFYSLTLVLYVNVNDKLKSTKEADDEDDP